MTSKSAKDKNLFTIKLKKFWKNNSTFLIILLVIIGITGTVIFKSNSQQTQMIYGDDIIEMHYFFLKTCPHCIEQKKFHSTLEEMYPNLKIISHDMAKTESYAKYQEFADNIEGLESQQFPGTPLTIINGEFNVGFGTPETTGQVLIEIIENKQQQIDANWNDSTMTRTIDLR